ncbi:MAG TPA: hypothetical protein VGL92_08875 [Acidimicrobiia bacterium]|jgi:hypothetical protein
MASTAAVRIFELVCLGLWLYGIAWVRRSRNPVYAGVYLGSTLLVGFDWIFNSNWFFRVEFDEKFIDLFRIQGVSEPLAMALNYAFYFGLPVLLLVHHREVIDRRFGRRGYLWVFLGACAILPMFEIPAVSWLHLWTYYQKPGFELGGVTWSNIWFSGMLTTSCYAAARLAVRWAAVPNMASVAGRGPGAAGPTLTAEERWRAVALGTASVWAAFYVSWSVQLLWYAVTQPWVATPRPF